MKRITLEQHEADIQSISNQQNQLRNTRETNMNLMKNVTLTMNKCIQRLRKKLDEKTININSATSECSGSGDSNIINENDNSDLHQETNIANDNEKSRTCASNSNSSRFSNPKNPSILNQKLDGHLETSALPLPIKETLGTRNPTKEEEEQQPQQHYHEPMTTSTSTAATTPKFIFHKTIELKPIHKDLEYMKQIWSQNYPSNCPMYEHSTLISDPKFPLHPPISSPEKLERMITISQYETMLQRQDIISTVSKESKELKYVDSKSGGSSSDCSRTKIKELLQDDYRRVLQGTCLDGYVCSQYDPFYVSLLPRILKASDYSDDESDVVEHDDDGSKGDGDDRGDDMGNYVDIDIDIDIDRRDENFVLDSNSFNCNKDEQYDDLNSKAVNHDEHHTIDPNTIICRYDLLGNCNDPSCPYQHIGGGRSHNNNSATTIKRIVRRKGSNKISIDTKKNKTYRPPNFNDVAVLLPSLNLPPLPHSISEDIMMDNQAVEGEVGGIEKDEEAIEDKEGDFTVDFSNGDSVVANEKSSIKKVGDETCRTKKRKANEMSQHESDGNDKKNNQDDSIGFSEVSANSDEEDDFIGLPDISISSSSDGDNCDYNDDESGTNDEKFEIEKHFEQNEISFSNNDANAQTYHLFDALSRFNFEVEKKNEHLLNSPDSDEGATFEVVYKGSSFIYDGNDNNSKFNEQQIIRLMNTLQLLANMSDAIRLCVFSGRADICRAIIKIGEEYCQHTAQTERDNLTDDVKGQAFLEAFTKLTKLLMSDLQKFSDGSFCGRGSISYISSFHTQLGLTMIAYFVRSYRQAVLSQSDFCLSEMDWKLFLRRYKRFAALALGMKYNFDHDLYGMGGPPKTQSDNLFPHHLLPKEAIHTGFVSSGSTPKVRFVKVFESFSAGQKIARCISEYIHCSDACRDPQLILDNLLHPLSNAIQSCVVSSKSSVAEDAIDNAINGEHTDKDSVGLPTQLCIFNIFGPATLVCFSGIFLLIKKQLAPGSGTLKALNSRQRGTILEAKNLIMMLIQHFDQSGIIGENFEGQLLLTPFFHLMATLLVSLGSYSKTQVLLENTLYTKEITGTRIWSVYSEALWSTIIQLQICFPDQSMLKLLSTVDIVTSFSKSRDLAALPLLYGLHVTRVYLQGDSTLVQYALFYRREYDGPSPNDVKGIKKRMLHLQDVREACCALVGNTIDVSKETSTSLNIKIVYENGLKIHAQTFPCSILLEGMSIERLSLIRTCLKNLPLSFGKYLPSLKVSLQHFFLL